MESNALAHYGVLGMKWGVRKNPSKAASKAVKKLHNIDKKRSQAAASAQGFTNVASQYRFNQSTALNRADKKTAKKNAKLADKLAKQSMAKVDKYTKKGQKWVSEMTNILGSTSMYDLSKYDLRFLASYGFDYNTNE